MRLPPRCGSSAAVCERAGGKMLAALQRVRKQTRAPNDSNKRGRRFPLRLRPAGTGGRAAACSRAGHGGEARAAGPRAGRGGSSCRREGSCSASLCGDTPGTRRVLRERPAEPPLPGTPWGALCRPGGCAPLLSPPHPPRIRRARGRGKVGVCSCLVWGL